MSNSENLLELIQSFYPTTAYNISSKDYLYKILVDNHLRVIDKYKIWWNDVLTLPANGTRVFAIQDLTSIGRGKFVGDYYYNDGFVANLDDTDPYGYIVYWISFDTIDMCEDLS